MKAESPEKVGKHSHGGTMKFVPMWMKRTVTVTPKAEPTVETPTKKTWKITINLWEIIKWLAILWFILWLFTHISITVVF